MDSQTKSNDLSKFFEQKARNFFQYGDATKKGTLTRDDYLAMADGFIAMNAVVDPQAIEQIRGVMIKEWNCITTYQGGSECGAYTEDSLVNAWKHQVNNEAMKAVFHEQFSTFMKYSVTKQDGYLDQDEYVRFYGGFENPQSAAIARFAFNAFDTDGDGKLSKEEIVNGYVHFMTSDDMSSPYKCLLGPVD